MNGIEEYRAAEAAKADRWVPGCGGTEQPFYYNGTSYLWVWNPAMGEHRYMNLDTDLIEPYPPFLD
jgi:hypothetical protein